MGPKSNVAEAISSVRLDLSQIVEDINKNWCWERWGLLIGMRVTNMVQIIVYKMLYTGNADPICAQKRPQMFTPWYIV